MRLEKEFNIQLSLEDAMSMNSVKDIISVIKKYTSKKQSKAPSNIEAIANADAASILKLPKVTSWGKGSIHMLSKVDQKNIVVMTGASGYAAEIKQKIQECLQNKATVSFIQKSSGEPKESDIYKVAEILKKESPDLIVAVGGGSCIDTAKLSWVLYEYPELKFNDVVKPFSLPPLRKKASFIAIPTTFGSGSEVSSAAVFSRDGSESKTIIISHQLIPDQVILDPNLGKSMSLNIVYASAFDALTHAIEGYVSVIHNLLVDPYAIYSVKSILSALQDIQQQGLTDRSLHVLCSCAYYAGIVQNHCSVGLTHSLAHQLGGYSISHGLGNALFLTLVMEYNAKGTEKYNQLAKECGFKSLDKLISVIHGLFKSAYILPNSQVLKKIVDDKVSIIELAMKDITFKTNPIALKKDDLESLFDGFRKKFLT
jgi:alcohol dehydrogenase class IV